MGLIKRKNTKQLAGEVEEASKSQRQIDLSIINRKIEVEKVPVLSTGSTLLDLAISGNRRYGGGIPGGIIMEIFGPSGFGKTAILAEICASAQSKNGVVRFCDPEARLDQEYTQIYGVNIKDHFDYKRPDTVSELFNEHIWGWEPENTRAINVLAGDSMAALSTDMEMEDADKMGMRRAKEFSEGLRKTCRLIAKNNWLIAFTNQIRQSQTGTVTPGGLGLPFYASLRIEVKPGNPRKIIKKTKIDLSGKAKEIEKVIGINSICRIEKSSIDDPHREAPIYIVFGYGIDDVRANLQYIKDISGMTVYEAIDKEFKSMDNAIRYVEENNLEEKLKEKVIDIWEKIEERFVVNRKRKSR